MSILLLLDIISDVTAENIESKSENKRRPFRMKRPLDDAKTTDWPNLRLIFLHNH